MFSVVPDPVLASLATWCPEPVPKTDAQAEIGTGRPSGLIQGIFVIAVRNGVDKLIRRGDIYWRLRIPAAFIHCEPGSRISL